tara:strand:- start:253 stop:1671 length:1419 start_codon:yes stop_codon:yes gene_type:complete
MKYISHSILLLLTLLTKAQVKIGDNPNSINPASILELEDSTRGLLISRMTTAQRNAISNPPDGLKIYNTTTSTMDIFRFDHWGSTSYTNSDENLIYVYSIDDLPPASGGKITLDDSSLYIFRGIVDVSPYYLSLNGATLRGLDPVRDGVASNVSGAILRSVDVSVYIEGLAIIPLSGNTKAYDFRDATKTKLCNLFAGNSVIDRVVPSLGVGQISGFKAVSIFQNYWSCKDGLKVTGAMGKLTCGFTLISDLTSGAGVEFLNGLVADDIDLSNNYFVYTGQVGVKLNTGATVKRGRMTTNIFRDVGSPLQGLDSYSLGWSMQQNTNIPDSRAYCFIYFNNNSTPTYLPTANSFLYKIAGNTTTIDQKRFTTSANNRITYNGADPITSKVSIVISAEAPSNNSAFSIGLGKNSSVLVGPVSSMAAASNGQSFQIILNAEVDLVSGDYLEVFIRSNNNNASSIVVEEMQFRVSD